MSDETFEGTLEEQVEKMRAALDRYKKENKTFREQRDALKADLAAAGGNEETLGRFRNRTVSAEAKLRLQALGVKDADRIVKLIDLSKVNLNDNDELEGLDESINAFKETVPELFDARKRVGGTIDSGNKEGGAPQKSATELQVAAALGRNR